MSTAGEYREELLGLTPFVPILPGLSERPLELDVIESREAWWRIISCVIVSSKGGDDALATCREAFYGTRSWAMSTEMILCVYSVVVERRPICVPTRHPSYQHRTQKLLMRVVDSHLSEPTTRTLCQSACVLGVCVETKLCVGTWRYWFGIQGVER
jgi:hypothetical protein